MLADNQIINVQVLVLREPSYRCCLLVCAYIKVFNPFNTNRFFSLILIQLCQSGPLYVYVLRGYRL